MGQSERAVRCVLADLAALAPPDRRVRLRTTLSLTLIHTTEPVLAMRYVTGASSQTHSRGLTSLAAACEALR